MGRPPITRTPFGEYLHRLLVGQGLTVQEFAGKVGRNQTFLYKIYRGEKPMTAETIEPWADALGLTGAARAEWLERAWATRTPEHILGLLAETRQELASARKALARKTARTRKQN